MFPSRIDTRVDMKSKYLACVLFVLWGLCGRVYGNNPGTSWRNGNAFAAVKENGTVEAWGDGGYGASAESGLRGVEALCSTQFAVEAVKEDGTVAAWGSSSYGGSGVPDGLSGVKTIYSTN